MPTLGTHFTDSEAERIQEIAAVSPQKRVSPWIGEAIRQRLEREGLLPGSPSADSARLAAELSRPGKPAEIVAAKLREAAVEIARLVEKEVA
jgi:hypothetical protein